MLDSGEFASPVSTTPTLRSPGGTFRPRGPPPPQPLAGGPPAAAASPSSTADNEDDLVLAEAEDPDSEEGDDDPDVDPDTGDNEGNDGGDGDGTSSTTAPSTSDRPGSFTGGSSPTPPSNSNAENRSPGEGSQHRLHPIFEAGPSETFNQKRARLDRSETISYGPQPPSSSEVHPVFQAPPFETFNQRRSRLDRSETISYGPQPPRTGDRPQTYPGQGPTTEHGFTVDVLDLSTDESATDLFLPEGWNIDEHGYMVLDDVYDTWEIKGSSLIRHHYVARNTLFPPQETGDCPVPVHTLTKVRNSYQGNHCHQDRWRNAKNKEGIWWTGRTVFKIANRDRHEAHTAFYTNSGGSPTYGGPKEKRQKDAKSLNERTLSLSDRLAFIDAKRKELGSFFTNSVWEFGTESEAPPGRILKAHFILKWSKNPDGTPRAKARLIMTLHHQPCPDWDAPPSSASLPSSSGRPFPQHSYRAGNTLLRGRCGSGYLPTPDSCLESPTPRSACGYGSPCTDSATLPEHGMTRHPEDWSKPGSPNTRLMHASSSTLHRTYSAPLASTWTTYSEPPSTRTRSRRISWSCSRSGTSSKTKTRLSSSGCM